MNPLFVITKREFLGYFTTPIAWIFLIVFVMFSAILTFYAGDFFVRNQADMQSFFTFQPWLYVLMIPAISMRLWAEERHQGTIELLMTLPFSTTQLVLGKFLASLAFMALALFLTIPVWITVNYLGTPDNGVIIVSYLASFLIAGTFLSVGSCVSAMTKNQIISFIISMALCMLLMFIGSDALMNLFAPVVTEKVLKILQSFSFLMHFASLIRGVLDFRDILFFISCSGLFLFATVIVLDHKKAV